ncbi:hypothetical protein HWV62_26150 [Athelia sp. TMB]|nr:hypothetical protein HWV62_26150 [Athelia sp. TMB]
MPKSVNKTVRSRYRPSYASYRPHYQPYTVPAHRVRSDSEEAEERAMRAEDLKPAEIRAALAELDLRNTVYKTCSSWDRSIRGWVDWDIPQRVLKNGTLQPAAPTSYHHIPDLECPLCPCSQNPFRTQEQCTMQFYRGNLNGKERWIFSARQHQCRFKVRKSQAFAYVQPKDKINDSDSDSDLYSPPSTSKTFASGSGSSSATSPPSTPASSSRVTRSVGEKNILGDGSPTRPIVLDNFDDAAEILAHVDAVNAALDKARDEVSKSNDAFTVDSSTHCAANRDAPPRCLQRYHPDFQPKVFEHMELDDSIIAQGFRSFNSAHGVTSEQFFLLETSTNLCVGCRNHFSIDGFRAHLANGGMCMNPKYTSGTPFIAKVPYHPAAASQPPPVELSEFHEWFNPRRADEFCKSMIGRALIEWNSIVGIPLDAWMTVRSAQTFCLTCDRTRSFDGHAAHLDGNGNCKLGGKGKGRAA